MSDIPNTQQTQTVEVAKQAMSEAMEAAQPNFPQNLLSQIDLTLPRPIAPPKADCTDKTKELEQTGVLPTLQLSHDQGQPSPETSKDSSPVNDAILALGAQSLGKALQMIPDDKPIPVGPLAQALGSVTDDPSIKLLEQFKTIEKHGSHFELSTESSNGIEIPLNKKDKVLGLPVTTKDVRLDHNVDFDLDQSGTKLTGITGITADSKMSSDIFMMNMKRSVKELDLQTDGSMVATVAGLGNHFDVKETINPKDLLAHQ